MVLDIRLWYYIFLVDYGSRIAYCESFAQSDIFSSGKKGNPAASGINQRNTSGISRIALTLHYVPKFAACRRITGTQ